MLHVATHAHYKFDVDQVNKSQANVKQLKEKVKNDLKKTYKQKMEVYYVCMYVQSLFMLLYVI